MVSGLARTQTGLAGQLTTVLDVGKERMNPLKQILFLLLPLLASAASAIDIEVIACLSDGSGPGNWQFLETNTSASQKYYRAVGF